MVCFVRKLPLHSSIVGAHFEIDLLHNKVEEERDARDDAEQADRKSSHHIFPILKPYSSEGIDETFSETMS